MGDIGNCIGNNQREMEVLDLELSDFMADKIEIIEQITDELNNCSNSYVNQLTSYVDQYQKLTTRMNQYDEIIKDSNSINKKKELFENELTRIGVGLSQTSKNQAIFTMQVNDWNEKLSE